jgi:MATE family multidrug resistance protein
MLKASSLTKYPAGSLREITCLAFPMMLTALSANLMTFFDRVILGHYSLEAMNSVAAASSAIMPFVFAGWAVASIAEIFVGQFNGAQKYERVGESVWQMIWFSVFLMAFFIPMGLYAGPFIITKPFYQEGLPYYKWIMSTGYLCSFNAALASFFIGRGKVQLVMVSAIVGNALNLGLDVLFVFGIEGFLEPMGTRGAAIATVMSEVMQVLILLVVFLFPSYRKKFHTHVWHFRWPIFKDCLKIGTPNAISHLISMSAWYFIFAITGSTGIHNVTVFQIGQTIFILFTFLADGLQKAVIALASNAIGEGKLDKVPRILKSSIKFHICMISLLAIPFLFFPEVFINVFLGDKSVIPLDTIIHHGRTALAWVWFFLLFDDCVWIIAGILTSAGDTKFVMIMNSVSSWCFGVLPVYIFIVILKKDPVLVWQLMAFYGLINIMLFTWRYQKGAWKKISITQEIKH